MLQHVLAIARAVLEPTEELDHLRVDVRDPDLGHRVLAGPADALIDLREGPLVYLLDPSGVDPAILHQLLEREAGGLATDGIEAAEDDSVGRVVDDKVHAGRRLEGADVATLTLDDPALHTFARHREHADRGLRGLLGRDALDRD